MEPAAPRRYQRYAAVLVVGYLFCWLLSQLAGSVASLPSSSNPLPTTPTWQNLDLISSTTRRLSSKVVAPKQLLHLLDPIIPERFQKVWIFSAFLDTRSMVFDGPPEVTMIASSASMFSERIDWTDSPLWCYIAIKKNGRNGKETFFKTHSTITAIPDGHVEAKTLIPVIYTCVLLIDGEVPDYSDSEIFVSMGAKNHPPPHDAFTIVTPLPEVNPQAHREGIGGAAVCFQPLVGDTYAASLRDFVSYYKLLGFTNFYVYLLNPGVETIGLMRDLEGVDGIEAIRWMLPNAWLYSRGSYTVDPRSWKIPGMEVLGLEEEYGFGTSGSDPPKQDVNMWAFAQNAAHHDCSFRAKFQGLRWVANVDWDEYLYLRPPSGHWPPTPSVEGASHITNWALSYDQDTTLPAAIEFQSAFTCSGCQPTQGPPKTDSVKEFWRRESGVDLLHPTPAVPGIFISPVRHENYFRVGYRCKSIIDPWAWFSSTIHEPIWPYVSYASQRCSDWVHKRSLATGGVNGTCAKDYKTVWKHVPGYAYPPPVWNQTTLKNGVVPTTEFSTGSMYHLRVSREIANTRLEWLNVAEEHGFNVFTAGPGSELMDSKRVNKSKWREVLSVGSEGSEEGDLIEDWSIVSTMGEGLMEILEERKSRPLKRWTGERWVGGEGTPAGGVVWIVAVSALGVGVVLVSLLRKLAIGSG